MEIQSPLLILGVDEVSLRLSWLEYFLVLVGNEQWYSLSLQKAQLCR